MVKQMTENEKKINPLLKLLVKSGYKYIVRRDDECFATKIRPIRRGGESHVDKSKDAFLNITDNFEKVFGCRFPCDNDDKEPIRVEMLFNSVNVIHKRNTLVARLAVEGEKLETLNGTVYANKGDYVITGINGEQYPCDPTIFTYLYYFEEND